MGGGNEARTNNDDARARKALKEGKGGDHMNAEQKVIKRFAEEFAQGLANVKFFVRAGRVSVTDLFEEIEKFEDAVNRGGARAIVKLDRDLPTTRFDAAFE